VKTGHHLVWYQEQPGRSPACISVARVLCRGIARSQIVSTIAYELYLIVCGWGFHCILSIAHVSGRQWQKEIACCGVLLQAKGQNASVSYETKVTFQ